MAYKQNWGLSRRHYQGNTSPINRMPHMDRLEKQSQTKFAGIDEEILPPSPLGNCGCPSPLNQEEEAYNMTPDATEEESKAVRDKFDRTYMKGSKKYNTGDLLSEADWESQGSNYNIQDVSEVQSDDKGQFVTTLGDDEITPSLGGKNAQFSSDPTIMPNALHPDVRVARDTIRPSKGKKFYKSGL